MIVTLHVFIAISSIALTSYIYARPSVRKLYGNYVLIALTLASGFYLAWSTPSHMIQTCVAGVMYIGVVSVGTLATRAKLAAIKI